MVQPLNVQHLQRVASPSRSEFSAPVFLKLGGFDMRSTEWIAGCPRDTNHPGVNR